MHFHIILKVKTNKTRFARFCEIPQETARFCEILSDSARFCKILRDCARFCKYLQDSSRFQLIMQMYARLSTIFNKGYEFNASYEGKALQRPHCPKWRYNPKQIWQDSGTTIGFYMITHNQIHQKNTNFTRQSIFVRFIKFRGKSSKILMHLALKLCSTVLNWLNFAFVYKNSP